MKVVTTEMIPWLVANMVPHTLADCLMGEEGVVFSECAEEIASYPMVRTVQSHGLLHRLTVLIGRLVGHSEHFVVEGSLQQVLIGYSVVGSGRSRPADSTSQGSIYCDTPTHTDRAEHEIHTGTIVEARGGQW